MNDFGKGVLFHANETLSLEIVTFFSLHVNVFSKMLRSQILHFSGDVLEFYFIPEHFVPNDHKLSAPALIDATHFKNWQKSSQNFDSFFGTLFEDI